MRGSARRDYHCPRKGLYFVEEPSRRRGSVGAGVDYDFGVGADECDFFHFLEGETDVVVSYVEIVVVREGTGAVVVDSVVLLEIFIKSRRSVDVKGDHCPSYQFRTARLDVVVVTGGFRWWHGLRRCCG